MQNQDTTTAPINRFKELFADRIEPRFSIDPVLDGKTVRIAIAKLEGMTEGETLIAFYGAHRDDVINCAIEAEISLTQLNCGSVWYTPSNPVELRKALADLAAAQRLLN